KKTIDIVGGEEPLIPFRPFRPDQARLLVVSDLPGGKAGELLGDTDRVDGDRAVDHAHDAASSSLFRPHHNKTGPPAQSGLGWRARRRPMGAFHQVRSEVGSADGEREKWAWTFVRF